MADFRKDPLMVSVLRAAVSCVGAGLPPFDDATIESLMSQYREHTGEHNATARFSAAKLQFDGHVSAFRHQFATVLGTCLTSQLDRLQGREPSWPAVEGNEPSLVSDDVIARRIAIDGLTREVDLDAEDGFSAFDVFVGAALDREPFGLRDNPLRPAAFFHALGLAWTKSGGLAELQLLRSFGPYLATRVQKAYPAMCALLRDGLGIAPRDSRLPSSLMQVSQSGAPYSRLARQSRRDAATPAMAATDPSLQVRTEQWSPASSAALLQGGRLFQPILTDERLPVAVRLLVSRLQIPVLGVALQEPDLYTDAAHPLRRLLVAVSQEGMWSKDVDARHLDSLLRELSWIVETANRLTGIGGQTRALFEQMVQQFRQRADETGLPVRPATLPG